MSGPPAFSENPETAPEAPPHSAARSARHHPGFIVLFSAEGPDRVGAWLPVMPSAEPRILGRGPAQAEDDYVRLTLWQQRPGQNDPVSPFESQALSRTQLLVHPIERWELHAKNVGRCPLQVNGAETAEAKLRPGDLLQIGQQLVLMCSTRPAKLAGPRPPAGHAFGQADAEGFVGESPAAWQLRNEIAFAAPRSGHTLVLGSTGTGKELVSTALHALSGRSGPFVARNAATLPESLVDAELFGNLKDYPNPGMPNRPGLIGAADGGTLFLDEFADLPASAQAHVLRVLDSGEYQRLGESITRRSKFRLVAATNRPQNLLRADMFARFDFRLRLPELVDRREDIPFIARHLFAKMALDASELCARFTTAEGHPKLSPDFVRRLAQHPFTGNVRELRSLLWSSIQQSTGWLEWPGSNEHEAEPIGSAEKRADEGRPAPGPDLAELQRVLAVHHGSIEKSWRELGLSSRYALRRLLRKHGLKLTKRASRD